MLTRIGSTVASLHRPATSSIRSTVQPPAGAVNEMTAGVVPVPLGTPEAARSDGKSAQHRITFLQFQ
jgi:hypothetical protein